MLVKRLKVENYKGFRDSGWLEFGPGFNIIVGQNNAGKTALLEAFRLYRATNKPHRSSQHPKGQLANSHSKFEIDLIVDGVDLEDALTKQSGQQWIPIPKGETKSYLPKFFGQTEIELSLSVSPGQSFKARKIPTHNLFSQSQSILVNVTNNVIETSNTYIGGNNDDIPQLVPHIQNQRIYVFRAERTAVGTIDAHETMSLTPDASNLAAVLMHMQGNNPNRYDRFNENVSAIFPMIKRVVVAPMENKFDIRIWTASLESERDDLAVRLEEAGTGVGHVLAILYVAMNLPQSVIVVDEPNSFLHPGAIKKLIQILRRYPHQYILSTHSPELIAVAEPSTLHLVEWDGYESKVEPLSGTDVAAMRRILGEVGVALSDVFSSDAVIWVEGQTEQECFPLIFRHMRERLPLGLSFLAVRNTGDFEAKDWRSKAIWELYERLTTANAILPTAIAFSFDREGRKEQEMEDLRKHSKGKVRFLPRRTYENYLLQPEAIAAVLDTFLEGGPEIKEETASQWIGTNGGKYCVSNIDPMSREWMIDCDAPRLLKDLFNELSEARVEYRKTLHSALITKWLLEHDPGYLEELCAYVVGLVEPQA